MGSGMTNKQILKFWRACLVLNLTGFLMCFSCWLLLGASAWIGVMGALNAVVAYLCAIEVQRHYWEEM